MRSLNRNRISFAPTVPAVLDDRTPEVSFLVNTQGFTYTESASKPTISKTFPYNRPPFRSKTLSSVEKFLPHFTVKRSPFPKGTYRKVTLWGHQKGFNIDRVQNNRLFDNLLTRINAELDNVFAKTVKTTVAITTPEPKKVVFEPEKRSPKIRKRLDEIDLGDFNIEIKTDRQMYKLGRHATTGKIHLHRGAEVSTPRVLYEPPPACDNLRRFLKDSSFEYLRQKTGLRLSERNVKSTGRTKDGNEEEQDRGKRGVPGTRKRVHFLTRHRLKPSPFSHFHLKSSSPGLNPAISLAKTCRGHSRSIAETDKAVP